MDFFYTANNSVVAVHFQYCRQHILCAADKLCFLPPHNRCDQPTKKNCRAFYMVQLSERSISTNACLANNRLMGPELFVLVEPWVWLSTTASLSGRHHYLCVCQGVRTTSCSWHACMLKFVKGLIIWDNAVKGQISILVLPTYVFPYILGMSTWTFCFHYLNRSNFSTDLFINIA